VKNYLSTTHPRSDASQNVIYLLLPEPLEDELDELYPDELYPDELYPDEYR
jgi:hypothetical protein